MTEHECGELSMEWSGTYGTNPRRVYWRCLECGRVGALLFPRCDEDERYPSARFLEADRAFKESAELFACHSALEFVLHAGEDWLARRNRFRPGMSSTSTGTGRAT